MVYGTDLLGVMHRHQLNEIKSRRAVVPADDIIRSATGNAADGFQRTGEFGEITPGARADLLVSAGNPLEDGTVLTQPDENPEAIINEGRFHENRLN